MVIVGWTDPAIVGVTSLLASRRREDLLQLLDGLNPTIAKLSLAIEREAEKSPQARLGMTHPGVGALTALAFVLITGEAGHADQSLHYSADLFEEVRQEISPDHWTYIAHKVKTFEQTWDAALEAT